MLAIASINCHAQLNSALTINGQISGLKNGDSIYLVNTKDTLGVTVSKSGKFIIKSTEPFKKGIYFIWLGDKSREENIKERRYLTLYIDKPFLNITGNVSSWPIAKVIGSESNTLMKSHDNVFNAFTKRYNTARINKDTDRMKKIADSMINTRRSFIEANLSIHYAGYLLLKTKEFDADEKERYYKRFSKEIQNSELGAAILKDISIIRRSKEVGIGKMAPDFRLNTPTGEQLNLYKVVNSGKLTILEFWASWCAPCRKETPNVKRIYDAYKNKGLNILSVSLDKNAQKWKDAIEKDGMDWYHVSDFKYWDSEAALIFKVNHVPQSYLLDSEGKIIAENLQGEKLRQKVEEVLGKTK